MNGIELIKNTLSLIKTLHEQSTPARLFGATGQPHEVVNLHPKTLEQLNAAIAECDELPLNDLPNISNPHENIL
jgi:hypothetical protein